MNLSTSVWKVSWWGFCSLFFWNTRTLLQRHKRASSLLFGSHRCSHKLTEFPLWKIGVCPRVLKDFNVIDKWEKFQSNVICLFKKHSRTQQMPFITNLQGWHLTTWEWDSTNNRLSLLIQLKFYWCCHCICQEFCCMCLHCNTSKSPCRHALSLNVMAKC